MGAYQDFVLEMGINALEGDQTLVFLALQRDQGRVLASGCALLCDLKAVLGDESSPLQAGGLGVYPLGEYVVFRSIGRANPISAGAQRAEMRNAIERLLADYEEDGTEDLTEIKIDDLTLSPTQDLDELPEVA